MKHMSSLLSGPCNVSVYQAKNFGDMLLIIPLIRVLCAQGQVTSVTVFCKSACAPILFGIHPKVETVLAPRGLLSILRTSIRYRIDLMLLPHASRTGFLVGLLSGASCLSVDEIKGILFWRARSLPKPMLPKRHTLERNLDLLRYLQITITREDVSLSVDHLLVHETKVVKELPAKYVVIHPGTRWMFKTPNSGFWKMLILNLLKLGFEPVITGTDSSSEGKLLTFLEKTCGVLSLAGQTSIPSLAKVISEAQGYIGVDTFATHMASAVGVRGIALYGPTSEFIWGPYGYGNRIKVVSSEYHPCIPCHNDGCGGGKISECLDSLRASQVTQHFVEALN